ncbi:hypothetical protein H0E87_026951, partial [Populus deltoides]
DDPSNGEPVIFYTGIADKNNSQIQNYAVPANLSDPYLREWVKPDDNPIVNPDVSVNGSAFRDPTTAWWADGHWRILIGSRRNHVGVAYLYRSRDLKKWAKTQYPLHSVSLDLTRYEYYTLGTYDNKKEKYFPDEGLVDGWAGLRLDYGNFMLLRRSSTQVRIGGFCGVGLMSLMLFNKIIEQRVGRILSGEIKRAQCSTEQSKSSTKVIKLKLKASATQADVDVTFLPKLGLAELLIRNG